MKPPYLLIPSAVSHDTVEALEFLLYEARRGEVIGIAYGAMMKRRSCIVDTAGEAHRNPMFAMGVVTMLCHEISNRAKYGNE